MVQVEEFLLFAGFEKAEQEEIVDEELCFWIWRWFLGLDFSEILAEI